MSFNLFTVVAAALLAALLYLLVRKNPYETASGVRSDRNRAVRA